MNKIKIIVSIVVLWAVLMTGLFLIKRTIREAFGHQEVKMEIRRGLEEVLIHWEVGTITLPRIQMVKQESGTAGNKGRLVVGIGHDVVPGDELKLGDKISLERVTKLFKHDVDIAFLGAYKLVNDYDSHPENVQVVLAAMVFQLGYHGAAEFKKMIEAVKDGHYELAAGEMLNSRWNSQTPRRCNAMASLMVATKKAR